MDNMDALVDLIRALSKKCDDFEYHKRQHDYYYKWYNEQQEKNEALVTEIDKLKRILDEANLDY